MGPLSGKLLLLGVGLAPALAMGQARHSLPLQFGVMVVGEPVSGVRVLDYEPAANSTDPIAVHAEEIYYRDSAGRTRSEVHYSGQLATVDILDFVANVHYRWTVGDTVVTRLTMKSARTETTQEVLDASAPLVEGVRTRHNRSVKGKDGHVDQIFEGWYAPDLHLSLVTIIDNPEVGKTTLRFEHVKREEPDAALFRVPDGYTIQDGNAPPPPPAPKPTVIAGETRDERPALPHAIEDDNYLEALKRFHSAVPQWIALNGRYHSRTDVRMVNLDGTESNATLEKWHNGKLGRDEETAPGWHSIIVWGNDRNWSVREGFSPLRLFDIVDVDPRPDPMERRIRILATGYVALKQKTRDGVVRSCSGVFGGAEICFDKATGLPVEASLDDERVVYEAWGEFHGARYPSRWALYRGHRLQEEAAVRVDELDESIVGFDPPTGAVARPNQLGAEPRNQTHEILSKGRVTTYSFGEALVKVSVDQSGRVRHAELLDADDRSLGAAAVSAAKDTVYMPYEVNGQRLPFETTFLVNQWSSIDPMYMPATSWQSRSPD